MNKTFDSWLAEEGIRGISGIDTRRLTKKLRAQGVMMGALQVSEDPSVEETFRALERAPEYGRVDLVAQVTVKEPVIHHGGNLKVAVLDCGIKAGILRCLLERGVTAIRLPYDVSTDDVLAHDPHGVLVSNGPGDPKQCKVTMKTVEEVHEAGVPIFGVCLGNQILSLALGGETYKLRYGHRGQNKPCLDLETEQCYVTSQNHGYAVDETTLPTDWEPWFTNLNDGTNEGIRHKYRPFWSVQFHPEASPGPTDTAHLFDDYLRVVSALRVSKRT